MTHDHEHSHSRRPLTLALTLTSGYCIVEFIGGWLTNSLALFSDAGHMLSDVTAMALSLFAAYIATLPVNSQKTFGYYRAEILAAFLNGLALWLIAGVIFREAYYRFFSPTEVHGHGMVLIAGVGLVVNVISVWLLHDSYHTNLNLRGGFLHVLSDLLGSSVIRCADMELAEVQRTLEAVEGVRKIHDLHIWTLTSNLFTLTAHAVVNGDHDQHALLNSLEKTIYDCFGIDHITIQLEPQDRQAGEPQHF